MIEVKQASIDTFRTIDMNLKRFYHIESTEQANDLGQYLKLPLTQAYPKVLKSFCVDSTNMKNLQGTYVHHYVRNITGNPNTNKTQRIVKELNDLTTSLPISETNAIFVRYDNQRMDLMKSLIFGSRDTPYAHGAFIFDIFVNDNYPAGPPLCNLETTGNGQIRFNPNLYHCGKVCLSLLGTWSGRANENWNPKLSTILQVLVSIQSIIMTEDVSYNEPGHEASKKTAEGKMINEGYSNIVKYANIKYAMVEAMKNPAPWFKEVILIHFYLKKDMILNDVKQWILEAETTNGKYHGITSSHNSALSSAFSKSKNAYRDKLAEVLEELNEQFSKLNISIDRTIRCRTIEWKRRPMMEIEDQEENDIETKVEKIDAIDVTYEEKVEQRAIDMTDEKVTNRWSRYIGAMGIDAVKKQANAEIILFGLNALGVEVAKNIILSGAKRITICDGKKVELSDLSGQFYLGENDIGKNRARACLHKLQALNQYVIIDYIDQSLDDCYTDLTSFLVNYNVVIACDGSLMSQKILNDYCRKTNIYFISAVNYGLFSRVFCDFGDKFTVTDKTGEEYQDLVLSSISNDEKGLVTLLENTRHNLQDGDEVVIYQVIDNEKEANKKSINNTHHKVHVVDKNSFCIGDTTNFRTYLRNGVMRQLKQSVTLSFKSLFSLDKQKYGVPPFDPTISSSDWNFTSRMYPLHAAYNTLDAFIETNRRCPSVWDKDDADTFLSMVIKELESKYPKQFAEIISSEANKQLFERIVKVFSYTCQTVFPPLAAFIGGVVSQEVIKAITKKYMPINQFFYYECSELVSGMDCKEMLNKLKNTHQDRDISLKRCIGEDLMLKLARTKLFMIGAGAIGCELLKNFAMLSLGTSKQKDQEGRIFLTDPDVIENSNLSRQFLFREKHIRKPKSTTAAAVAVYMNNKLRGNIMPLVEKVHDQTEGIFNTKFYEGLTIVANALDNVNARRYVDSRCVKYRKPLLESGTLGPKGHVQIILPFKTESYGSQQDPQEDNEIPYCTLKMFPEETLHCVEWARDKFGRMFTQKPKSFEKVIESSKTFDEVMLQEHAVLAEAYKFIKSWPDTFDDCISWARNKFEKFFVVDIKQLMKVYPLDHKLENGNLFWTLPKRPPNIVSFDPKDEVHMSFVAACACLRAITCNVSLPKDAREPHKKASIASKASMCKIKEFIDSEKKSQLLKEQGDKGKDAQNDKQQSLDSSDKEALAKDFMSHIKQRVGDLAKAKELLRCYPQEFEKDVDENFHIDVLYAMTNCRALNYSLEKMDWITVKLKAGRIVPALATTTSAIAGLQTIELVKVLANVKVDDHRNSFLNLSLPILAQSEPSPAPVHVLSPYLKVNLWDRWDIDLKILTEIVNLKALFTFLASQSNLDPLDCMRGNTAIYLSSLMNMPNKRKEKESILSLPLIDVLGVRVNFYS